jgi:hypothetical protein
MDILEPIRKYYDAQKQMIEVEEELEKESGIVICGLPVRGVQVFQGIEKFEQLPGAVTTIETGERFKPHIRKTVKVDGLTVYQLGWYDGNGIQFEKAVVK